MAAAEATVLAFEPPDIRNADKTLTRAKTINAERRERTAPHLATREDVEKAIEDMPEAYFECRDPAIGHDWRWHDVIDYGREIERQFKCHTCTSVKFQVLDVLGYIVRSDTKYSDGYLLKGIGRTSRDTNGVFRLAASRKHARRPADDG